MKKRLLTIVPFLLGLFLCGYPLISSLVERQHQQNAVATYKGMINKESLETLKESTERAKRYNNLLWQVNDAIVGDIGNRELSDESYQELLNLSEKRGKIIIENSKSQDLVDKSYEILRK